MFVIGDHVRGGFYGTPPSLTDLDKNGNLKAHVPFHSVYATLLDNWLHADSRALLGVNAENLNFFRASPSGTPINEPIPVDPPPVTPPIVPPISTTPVIRPITYPQGYRVITAHGRVSSFGGAATIGNASSTQITTVAATPSQKGYWLVASDGGIFCFGDATYSGNKLTTNDQVVGITV